MRSNIRPLAKARNGSSLHCVDAQWAAEQAFVSARAALGWSRDKLATKLVKKQFVSARKILLKIAQTQMESGYPYIVYIDEANRQHALKD